MHTPREISRIGLAFVVTVIVGCAQAAFAASPGASGRSEQMVSHSYHHSACAALDRKIEYLQERRREGYSIKQGERTKKKLRKAMERRRELDCRRTGKPSA